MKNQVEASGGCVGAVSHRILDAWDHFTRTFRLRSEAKSRKNYSLQEHFIGVDTLRVLASPWQKGLQLQQKATG